KALGLNMRPTFGALRGTTTDRNTSCRMARINTAPAMPSRTRRSDMSCPESSPSRLLPQAAAPSGWDTGIDDGRPPPIQSPKASSNQCALAKTAVDRNGRRDRYHWYFYRLDDSLHYSLPT